MHHRKFIFMFVAWYCVNTVNGSPISFENKLDCGDKCKAEFADVIEIDDHQWNLQHALDLNLDLQLPTFTGRIIPKRKRQTHTDASDVPISSPEATTATDPVKVTTQIESDGQSKKLPSVPKDEADLTVTLEYKKAQENLLSASEQVKVKDSQVADGTSLDGKNLPNTNFPVQDIIEIETVDNILSKNYSTNSISSPTEPSPTTTEISRETKETVSIGAEKGTVKSDGKVESGFLSEPVDILVVEPFSTTEAKNEVYDSTKIRVNGPMNFNEPSGVKSNAIQLYKSDDNSGADVLMTENDNLIKSGSSTDKTGLSVNSTLVDIRYSKPTAISDTKNREVPVDSTDNKFNAVAIDLEGHEVQEKTTKNISNAVVINPAVANKTGDDSFPNSFDTSKAPEISIDPKIVSISGELHHNETDSIGQDTTTKLDAEPEQLGISKQQADSKEIETKKSSTKHDDIPMIPNSPTTSPNSGTSKEKQIKNDKDGATDDEELDFNNNFANQDESQTYNLVDWDEKFTETSPFDDIVDDPFDGCDCSQTDIPKNYGNMVENHSTDTIEYSSMEEVIDEPCVEDCDPTEYSTNYGNIDENLDQIDGTVEYSQHTDDNLSHFSEDFDPENNSDGLFNSDIEFNSKQDNNCDHFDEDTDDFDFVDNFW